MKIRDASVVEFKYRLFDKSGKVLDSTDETGPVSSLIGSGEMLESLEEALLDRKPGDKFELSLTAEDAFGEYDDSLEIEIELSEFPDKPELDAEYLLGEDDLDIPYRVTNIGAEKVSLNGNHEFAGKDVRFEVEITSVRDATDEELSHGHVHSDGECTF